MNFRSSVASSSIFFLYYRVVVAAAAAAAACLCFLFLSVLFCYVMLIANIFVGDTTVRIWDIDTETPKFTCKYVSFFFLSLPP